MCVTATLHRHRDLHVRLLNLLDMSGVAQTARNVFKRARRGLFAGKMKLSGNNVSEDGGNR